MNPNADDFHPADFPVEFDSDRELLSFTFSRGGDERMVAVWIPNPRSVQPHDFTETTADVTLRGIRAGRAWVIDLMNGAEQELILTPHGRDTLIPGMRVKDYPTLVRFFQE